jgi:hypothetical protein
MEVRILLTTENKNENKTNVDQGKFLLVKSGFK